MSGPFYDKITRKFGTLPDFPTSVHEFGQEGNPEELFEQKILALSGADRIALDLGCGDGQFTLRLAPSFREIVGIDSSRERLKLASAARDRLQLGNVRFEEQDASQTSFGDGVFDLVYSRRGPTPYLECYRITRTSGHMVAISIGEKDTWDLKRVFGRGQGYRVWKTSALALATEQLGQAGLAMEYGQDLQYDEYYATYEDLNLFLQRVPIFEDYDSEQDLAANPIADVVSGAPAPTIASFTCETPKQLAAQFPGIGGYPVALVCVVVLSGSFMSTGGYGPYLPGSTATPAPFTTGVMIFDAHTGNLLATNFD
jgi:SAM-dependent methyltransferase